MRESEVSTGGVSRSAFHIAEWAACLDRVQKATQEGKRQHNPRLSHQGSEKTRRPRRVDR